MSDWVQYLDEKNTPYFWNSTTNETRWDMPYNEDSFESEDDFDEDSIYELPPEPLYEIPSDVVAPPPVPPPADYAGETKSFVTIFTGNKIFGGTTHDVNLIFADKMGRVSTLVNIKNQHGSLFHKGTSYQKRIGLNYQNPEILTALSNFRKVRIWTSGGGIAKDDWYLDKIQLQVTVDDKTDILMFNFQKWIGYGKKYEAKEVRAPDAEETKYYIKIKTGNQENSGTDGTVRFNFIGSKGDTGLRKLKTSETHFNKFEKSHVDIFKMHAVNIGKLNAVTIELKKSSTSSLSSNEDWFLESIWIGKSKSYEGVLVVVNQWIKIPDRKLKTRTTVLIE